MKTILLCIGSELLSDKINSNILLVADFLKSIGLKLSKSIVLPDIKKEIVSTVKETLKHFDIIITTGGLGPTFDDLTRESISEAIEEKLIFESSIMKKIEEMFKKRNISMPQGVERQAYIIKNAKIIPNRVGTAAGQIIEKNNKTLILLPGPPNELLPMLEDVKSYLLKKSDLKRSYYKKTLHIAGLFESKVNEIISPIIKKYSNKEVSFSILPHESIIDIKIEILKKEPQKLLNEIRSEFYDVLRNYIYGEDNETLESVVGKLLLSKNKTISVAESCTGGLISNKITNVPGSSKYFLQSVVAYSNKAKIKILKVNPLTIKKYGAVSKKAAIEMAKGIKKISNSDIAISTTGIAGPTGGSKKKPVGLVYFGYIDDNEVDVKEMYFSGDRESIKEKASIYALNLVRLKVERVEKTI